jgi:hypothetical protein
MVIQIQKGNETRDIEVSNLAFGFDINNYANDAELMYMIPIESQDSNYLDETLVTIPLEGSGWKIILKGK